MGVASEGSQDLTLQPPALPSHLASASPTFFPWATRRLCTPEGEGASGEGPKLHKAGSRGPRPPSRPRLLARPPGPAPWSPHRPSAAPPPGPSNPNSAPSRPRPHSPRPQVLALRAPPPAPQPAYLATAPAASAGAAAGAARSEAGGRAAPAPPGAAESSGRSAGRGCGVAGRDPLSLGPLPPPGHQNLSLESQLTATTQPSPCLSGPPDRDLPKGPSPCPEPHPCRELTTGRSWPCSWMC